VKLGTFLVMFNLVRGRYRGAHFSKYIVICILISGVPGIFFGGGGGGSTNSVEDRGQREQGSGGGSPLVTGSTQFANV
jgi:hypothetical protein